MKTSKFKLILLLIFTSQIVSFGQWSNPIYLGTYGNKLSMDFCTPDKGVIIFTQDNEPTKSYYFCTKDSGLNWQKMDTLINVSVNDISFKYNWGLICGNRNQIGRIELFNELDKPRFNFDFPTIKDIVHIQIVDSLNAIISAVNTDNKYFLGHIKRNGNTIELLKQNILGSNEIKRIKFFTKNDGYFQRADSLFRTEDLGISKIFIANYVQDYDFFNLETGMYSGISYYSTVDKGNSFKKINGSISSYGHADFIMNSSHTFFDLYNWVGISGGFYLTGNDLTGNFPISSKFNDPNPLAYSVKFVKEKYGFIASLSGNFYRTSNISGVMGLNQQSNGNNVLNISPNPVINKIKFTIPDGLQEKTVYYWITNLEGKALYSESINIKENKVNIDVSDLKPGIYLLNVSTSTGTHIGKFLKK